MRFSRQHLPLLCIALSFCVLFLEYARIFSFGTAQADPQPVVPADIARGLNFAYFELDNTLESQTPVEEGVVETFDLSTRQRDHNFAFRFTGYISVPLASEYQFHVVASDFFRLQIDGMSLVTLDPTSDENAEQSDRLFLQVGFYPLRVDFSRGEGEAEPALEVEWSSDIHEAAPIATEHLFRDDPDVAPTPTELPLATPTPTPGRGGTSTLLPTSTPTAPASVKPLGEQIFLPSVAQPQSGAVFVFFRELNDGATLSSPLYLKMGASNFTIEPALAVREGAGHFHLVIDTPCVTPGTTFPHDSAHRDYADGSSEATLDLSPGEHTLCLQAGDGEHVALDLTHEIAIRVERVSTEPKVAFVAPADGTVLNGPVQLSMEAQNFVIEPAGASMPGRGHFHVMIDAPCVTPGNTIPRDVSHVHFGQGQHAGQLALEPGLHVLCLQAGDGFHTALGLTEQITITVQLEAS